jgi:hypothetical protein
MEKSAAANTIGFGRAARRINGAWNPRRKTVEE